MNGPGLSPTSRVLLQVDFERTRQDARWGEQNHPNGTGQLEPFLAGYTLPVHRQEGHVTMAAFASTAKRVVNGRARRGQLTYFDVLLEEVAEAAAEADPAKLRAELVQVAAVAVAFVEKLDREAVQA